MTCTEKLAGRWDAGVGCGRGSRRVRPLQDGEDADQAADGTGEEGRVSGDGAVPRRSEGAAVQADHRPGQRSGLKIVWQVESGSMVKPGDPIVRFDPSGAKRQLDEKAAVLRQAQAALDQAIAQARINGEQDKIDHRAKPLRRGARQARGLRKPRSSASCKPRRARLIWAWPRRS